MMFLNDPPPEKNKSFGGKTPSKCVCLQKKSGVQNMCFFLENPCFFGNKGCLVYKLFGHFERKNWSFGEIFSRKNQSPKYFNIIFEVSRK